MQGFVVKKSCRKVAGIRAFWRWASVLAQAKAHDPVEIQGGGDPQAF